MKNDPATHGSMRDKSPLWRQILGLPQTPLGRWSAGLLAGFVIFFILFQILVASGQRGGETLFSNPWLAWSMLIAVFSAIASGVTALIAILWKSERSFLLFISSIWGAFVAFIVLMQVLSPL